MDRTVSLIGLAVVAVVALVLLFGAAFTVNQTEQALVFQLGEPKRLVNQPGLHFKLPLVQNVVRMDKRTLSVEGAAVEVIASDQKRLVVDAYLRYRITDPLQFYQSVRTQASADARLSTIMDSNLRQVLGRAPLLSIVSEQRVSLMDAAKSLTAEQAKSFGIEIIDVRIKRTDLPDATSQSIYNRMRADRDREAKQYRAQGAEQGLTIRSDADRQRTVILADARRKSETTRGEGDAEAIRVFADAYGRDSAFFTFYRTMQAYREALLPNETTVVLTPESDFLKFFRGDLSDILKATPAPVAR